MSDYCHKIGHGPAMMDSDCLKEDCLVCEIERLQDWLNVKTESAKINERIRERLAAENDRLQARVEALERSQEYWRNEALAATEHEGE